MVQIWFSAPEFQQEQLAEGDYVTIHEQQLVGEGRIVKVQRPGLHRLKLSA